MPLIWLAAKHVLNWLAEAQSEIAAVDAII
jgi:hypothetical protein